MKTLICTFALLLMAQSCDQPQRNRLNNVATGNGFTTATPAPGATNSFNTGTTSGSTTGATNSGVTSTPGFSSCDITAKYYANGIGWTGICQSTLDETYVMVNTTVSSTARTCLIATYKDSAGNSTYLSNQPQCFIPTQNVISTGNIYKTRSGYSAYAINGVMIMKEASVAAYYTCMDTYTIFVANNCPGTLLNAACDAQARALMATKCNDFKAMHAYLDIRLKN